MCEIFWNSNFLHYYFFGILGPVAGGLAIVCLRKKVGKRFILKASLTLALSSFVAFIAQIIMTGRCEIALLGESEERIYDIGLVIITLPIFFIFFMFTFAAVVLVHSKIHRVS